MYKSCQLNQIKDYIYDEVRAPEVPEFDTTKDKEALKASLNQYLKDIWAYSASRGTLLLDIKELETKIDYFINKINSATTEEDMRNLEKELADTEVFTEFKKNYDRLHELFPVSYSIDTLENGRLFLYDFAVDVITWSYSDIARAKKMLKGLVYFQGDGKNGFANAFNLSYLQPNLIETTGPLAWLIIAIVNYEIPIFFIKE